MEVSKQVLGRLLSEFSGDYKEVFLEKAVCTHIFFYNGESRMTAASNSGASFLSRANGTESFFSVSDMADYMKAFEEAKKTLPANPAAPVELEGPESAILDPTLDEDQIRQIAEWMKKAAKNLKSDFLQSYNLSLRCTHQNFIVANVWPHGAVFAADERKYHSLILQLIGKSPNGAREEISKKISEQDIFSTMTQEKIECFVSFAMQQLEEVLSGIPSPSGFMDVVIGNEAGGTIIHEAIGHALEWDGVHRTIYADKMGQKVAHESVNIIDDPTRGSLRGYYNFDHEGTKAQKTYLIKDGVLVSYLHNNKSAQKYETSSTGHGRRQEYDCTTLVRMGTTYLDAGTATREELIARVKDGIYVSAMGGGQVNPITGDFMFQVWYGRRIKDGKLGEVIRWANISGNGPKMLQDIQGIANDLDYFDGGTCGKGQQMPVSDATPTILVNLKVSGIQ